MSSLYIHIPFCASACPYCDFAFVVGRDGIGSRYVDALIAEFSRRSENLDGVDTVYFGGGTPSALAPPNLGRILNAVNERFDISEAEVTLEANPNDHAKFADFRNLGITRLSLGVQSTNLQTLKRLGRTHGPIDVSIAVDLARQAGFDNVNVDAIFGCPDQSLSDWKKDLTNLLELGPDHLSLYGLTVEPETQYARLQDNGQLPLPDEDTQSAMYDFALSLTERAGLEQYEISNFARPRFESRHNLACWNGQAYLGIGMSAHSFLGRRRTWNARRLNDYLDRIESGDKAQVGFEILNDQKRQIERVMLGLRTRDGIDVSLLSTQRSADRLVSENLIEHAGNGLRLTHKGKHIADLVCAELVRDL